MVKIEIDGVELEVENGSMVIEAADEAGIRIPRFCYHKKLSISANCRMCLVEVEKAAKPMPACATPVTDGMKVLTKSTKAIAAQKGVMEFLLINHPLDCPICDQGGECELQDVAMGYGGDVSKFSERKRVVREKDIGALIATDMTRCIHCTRCVRFGEEIAGLRELGATGRGEHMEIGTYIQKAVTSEMSGNVIDICPVGALTSKPYRYSARAWEMRQHESIAPHDCIGSNVFLHMRRDKVMRVVPRENEAINETWISDRDRFSYQGLYSDDRLTAPMMKVDGEWRETEWDTALEAAAGGLKDVYEQSGAKTLGALIAPTATTEEMYLTQKILRGLGSGNVDHRLRQRDFSDQAKAPAYPNLGMAIGDLENLESVLLVGSDIRREQPIAGHRIRKAYLHGGAIMAVNPVDYDFNFELDHKIIVDPRRLELALAGIAKAALDLAGKKEPEGLSALLAKVPENNSYQAIAQQLSQTESAGILLGFTALNHQNFATIRALSSLIAETTSSKLGYLSDGPNGAGAWLSGAVPHRGPAGTSTSEQGKNAMEMMQSPLSGYLLVNLEPDVDVLEPKSMRSTLAAADFVVALTNYKTPALLDAANVLLPTTPFSEGSGTFVNVQGDWQSFTAAVPAMGQARPSWKILRVLGNLFSLDGFEYMSSEEVRNELHAQCDGVDANTRSAWQKPVETGNGSDKLVSITDIPIYSIDAIVRRSGSLQVAQKLLGPGIRINDSLAQRIGLNGSREVVARQGDVSARFEVEIDNRVPENCIWIHADVAAASNLGAGQSPIELEKV